MARWLCFEERVRIEEMAKASCSASEAARRLGRHPVTVRRELGRGGPGGHRAEATLAGADARARKARRAQTGRGHGAGRGGAAAPQAAVVAAGDQRGPQGGGDACVRGDDLPGVL